MKNKLAAQLEKTLPVLFENALISYSLFSEEGAHKTLKDFKAHHDACRVAAAQLLSLVKLVEWLYQTQGDEKSENMDDIIRQANAEIEGRKKRKEIEADEGDLEKDEETY